MVTLAITNFNVVCATLGGFISLFGLVSYLFKERFYLSEALISFLTGVAFSPHATHFIKPLEYAQGVEENINYITLYFSRLVLGIQLVIAGVQLPSRYLKTEWRMLSILLGPGMAVMWMSSSLMIWAMVPNLSFLHAIAIGACVTPTDPVLSNSIVKGKFADKNIPKELQKIIIAESGANDGLGYPFLFIALYLLKYTRDGGLGQPGGASLAMGYWFGNTWGYVIILSAVYGFAVGWLAKELLHYAEEKKYVDRENFLVFAVSLALFIIGTCGMIGSDDVLACFVAGNAFTWDDWFRLETLDDSLQPTIDMLLNLSIFMWYGAIAPWASFRVNNVIPIYRLIPLGIMILLFRRLPFVFLVHKKIKQIEHWQQALFVGFFGPIGVSAIFYLYVSIEFLDNVTYNGEVREDAQRLKEVMHVVIWFLATCSIIVHGLSIPLGKVGYHLPRTMSMALITSQGGDSETSIPVGLRIKNSLSGSKSKKQTPRSSLPVNTQERGVEPSRPVFGPGGAEMHTGLESDTPSGLATPNNEAVDRPDKALTSAAGPPMDGPSKTEIAASRRRKITFADSKSQESISPTPSEKASGSGHNDGRTMDREGTVSSE